MRTTRRIATRAGALLVAAVAAIGATATTAPAAEPSTPYRDPVTSPLPDPGVVRASDGRWIVLSTGSWTGLHVGIASSVDGPYTTDVHPLLSSRPAWMSKDDTSVWAPSIIETSTGHYAVYYAGVVAGTDGRRCIGSATTDDLDHALAHGFTPADQPVACWKGSGTGSADVIANEGGGIGLIDATPSWIDGSLVLTYKTEFKKKGSKTWHTTTRLLGLNPAAPGTITRASIKISDSKSSVIEENPVLVKHGARYTLFTSYGLFGRCAYTTRYRQNDDLWKGWRDTKSRRIHTLAFPMGKKLKKQTCGTGNAQVIQVPGTNDWRIFFNGHLDYKKNPHAVHDPRGPQGLYIATITWSKGKPHVGTYVRG